MNKRRYAVAGIALFAFFGIAVATYIAQSQATGTPLICNIENINGCNDVVNSEYGYVMGISLANLGLIFYALVFTIALSELFLRNQMLRFMLQALAVIGILVSAYGVFTQVFLIEALCLYCLTSAAITVFIFGFAVLIEPIKFKSTESANITTPI